MINVTPEQVQYKKRVGKIGNLPVIELATTGGLHLIVCARGGQAEVLGTGPHRAVARFIAKKREDKIEWSDLEKADYVDPAFFQDILPRYESLTDDFRSRQGL